MNVRVETVDGYSVPEKCFVGVRIGDVLKQRRYEPQHCYNFPAVDRRRNAKIDIYRHVGSCCFAVDPDEMTEREVKVAGSDPSAPDMKLKVNVQGNAVTSPKSREVRTKASQDKALDYLTKHNIQEALADAVKALLKTQPSDPMTFICNFLTENVNNAPTQLVRNLRPTKDVTYEADYVNHLLNRQNGRAKQATAPESDYMHHLLRRKNEVVIVKQVVKPFQATAKPGATANESDYVDDLLLRRNKPAQQVTALESDYVDHLLQRRNKPAKQATASESDYVDHLLQRQNKVVIVKQVVPKANQNGLSKQVAASEADYVGHLLGRQNATATKPVYSDTPALASFNQTPSVGTWCVSIRRRTTA